MTKGCRRLPVARALPIGPGTGWQTRSTVCHPVTGLIASGARRGGFPERPPEAPLFRPAAGRPRQGRRRHPPFLPLGARRLIEAETCADRRYAPT